MRVYTRFKATPYGPRPGGGFYWFLALLLAVFLGWIWWQAGRTPEPPKGASSKRADALHPKPANLPARPGVTNTGAAVRSNAPPANTKTNPPAPVPIPAGTNAPRFAQTLFEAQLALARRGISAGSLDGVTGSQTRAALRAFQQQEKLPVTGDLDAETKARLTLPAPPMTTYLVTSNDLARLQPVSDTWLGKSRQTALDYETILELVAEKSRSHPAFIRRLNPGVNWTNIAAGTVLQVPNAIPSVPRAKAALIKISLANKTLQAFDAGTNLLAHFPCSIARRVEKRPVGELHVAVYAANPNYTLDPENFPESAEAQELKMKLILPPGPNNPVGTVWIGLDKPGYGIHGTPWPENVGRTESHGCFRLANWNAEFLLKLVDAGVPVLVEP